MPPLPLHNLLPLIFPLPAPQQSSRHIVHEKMIPTNTSTTSDTLTSALVVHHGNNTNKDSIDDTPGTNNDVVIVSRNNEIVLDALSYVEALDPTYEQYALSLVEAEMQAQQQQQQANNMTMNNIEIHPSLRGNRNVTREASSSLGKRAPLAAAAYEALALKKRKENHIVDDDGEDIGVENIIEEASTTTQPNIPIHSSSTIDELKKAIAQSKIQFEYQRLRYTNLELHSLLETPHKYTSYLSSLERSYTIPTATAVEEQRLVVDGINATRMEEQTTYMNKLMKLHRKYGILVDKNWKLGRALECLQSEVDALLKTNVLE